MEKEGFPSLPETSGLPEGKGAETGFILGSKLMFLNIEFYLSFYRNSALLHGIS
jgi:hypothetical protein